MTDVLSTTHPTAVPFDRLAATLSGRLLRPDHPDYPSLAVPWNVAVPSAPAAVVAVADATDVAATVTFAAQHGLYVDVRATGHGAIPADSRTLLVHTGGLSELTVHADGRWARVGAGVRWQQVLDAAAPFGLTGLCGSSPHVGVVGFLTGGGLGPLSRTFGLGSDHVRAFEVVTGDGELRRASATENPALFWGLRGGKGSLGVVTAVELDLLPIDELYGGALFFAESDIPAVLHAWRTWAPGLPEQASTSVAVMQLPAAPEVPPPLAGRMTVAVRYAWTGEPLAGEAVFAPMRAVAAPVLGGVQSLPAAAIGSIHADPVDPMPVSESAALLRDLPSEAVNALLAAAGPTSGSPQVIVELRLLGGAIARTPAAPGVVAHPDAAFSLLTIGIAAPPMIDATRAHAASTLTAMTPWTDGGTLPNFGGPLTAERAASAYSPADLVRLARLATGYDPHHVLTGTRPLRASTGAGTADQLLHDSEVADVWD